MPDTYIRNDEVLNVHCNSAMGLERSKLEAQTLQYAIPFEELRIVGSATNAQLPNAADSTNLGLYLGTPGTTGFSVKGSDAGGTTKTEVAAFRFCLPPEYTASGTIQVVAYGGMETTVASSLATVDFSIWKANEANYTHGSDLVTTVATSINSLTLAAKAFDVTASGISGGDWLSGRITAVVTDVSDLGVMRALFTKFYFLLAVKG